MSRVCTGCDHPERRAIDEALVGGDAKTKLSSLFAVSEQELRRHRENHPPAKLVHAPRRSGSTPRRMPSCAAYLVMKAGGAAFWT